ncbi:inward rectifier potassium channel 16-like [Stigmatopora argus]
MSTGRRDEVEVAVDASFDAVEEEGRRLRFMLKDGSFPVVFHKVPREWSPYLLDIFTTLVEIRWTVMLLVFSLSYIVSWLLFALCYWLIEHVNGDGEHPCVLKVHGFTSAFLFSVESQATIGYGFRGLTANCAAAVVALTVQSVFSCLLDTVVIGIVVAKMASARKRAQTVGFSKFAVVNRRDGVLCLSWRLGDFRGNHILEGVARAQLVRYAKGPRGPVAISYHDVDVQNRDLVLATPATVVHKLEAGSPLYKVGPRQLPEEDFELVVSFTYTGDSTGMLHQTRTSYAPADIRWAQRFREVVRADEKHYKADFALFNQTAWVATPMLSGQQYEKESRRAAISRSYLDKRGRRRHRRADKDVQQTYL